MTLFKKKNKIYSVSFCMQAVHQCSLISLPNILKRRVRGFNWACSSFKLSGLFLTLPGELTITSSEFLWGPHGIGHGSWQQVPGQFLPLLLLVERMSHCEPLLQRDETWVSVAVGPIKLLRMRSADSSISPGPSWKDILASSCSCRGRVGKGGGGAVVVDRAGEPSGQGSGCWAGLEAPAFFLRTSTHLVSLCLSGRPDSLKAFSFYTLSSSGLQSHTDPSPLLSHTD